MIFLVKWCRTIIVLYKNLKSYLPNRKAFGFIKRKKLEKLQCKINSMYKWESRNIEFVRTYVKWKYVLHFTVG